MPRFNFGTVFFASLLCLCLIGIFSIHMRPATKMIIFDAGGIAEARVGILKNLIVQRWGILEREAQEVVNKWHASFEEESPDRQWWESYAASMGVEMPSDWIDQFNTTWKEATAPIPGIIALVKSLQQQGYKVALLSDCAPLEREMISKMGYYDLFSPVISRVGSKSYKPLFKELHRPPSACLLIDGRQENIKRARKAGMDTIYFISVSELYKELELREIFLPCNTSEMLFYID
jgi:HAD superfamily hydrolase (TIGR01509 family)